MDLRLQEVIGVVVGVRVLGAVEGLSVFVGHGVALLLRSAAEFAEAFNVDWVSIFAPAGVGTDGGPPRCSCGRELRGERDNWMVERMMMGLLGFSGPWVGVNRAFR